jgi:signal transduction histidine kinase/CheY-like chemotaxis protein
MTPLDTLLENMFPSQVTGINAVFETDTRTITYKIIDGKAVLLGEGRLIHQNFEDRQRQIQLAEPVELFSTDDGSNVTKTLILSLVPNDEFYQIYHTTGPTIAAIVVVCSILLTILVFFLYDFYVRREFNAKRELLEARRQFMRFVSHEVRTPLNAVSMGLDLMQSEVAQALGFDSPTTFRSRYDMVDDEAFEASDRTNWSADSSSAPSSGETSKMRRVESSSTLESMGDIHISSSLAKSWFQLSQEIQGSAQGAVDILNDLLNYDKIEQGTLNLCLEILPIWELIEEAVMEFKVPASSKKVGLTVVFGLETRTTPRAQSLPSYIRNLKVAGDPVRLLQVVRNLMSNALKFTPAEGSIRVQAIYLPESEDILEQHFELQEGQIVTGYNRGSLRVRVIDTGAGMSKDQVDDLFQEGVQFNANVLQAGGGSGLGLFIAKGIVSQHNGNLSASSEGLNHGTTFEMALPLLEITSSNGSDTEYDVEAGMPVEYHGSGTVTTTNHSLLLPKSKLKVLVVDDVKSNRKLLRRILENKGHECDEAEDGQECVDMVRKALGEEMPYDSILLDYEMPGMDGPTAAKEIRRTLLDDDTNIVGVTGNVLPEDVNYFKKCGANDVLSKPVKIADLFALWETHCILLTNNNSR